MGRAFKRILRELKDIEKNPDTLFDTGRVVNNMFHWKATIMGPPDSPYVGGAFHVTIYFPPEYPLKPPGTRNILQNHDLKFLPRFLIVYLVSFRTKIFHPNIGSNGNIGLDISKENWSPALNISKLFLPICSLLTCPIPDDALVPAIGDMFKADINKWYITVVSWTRMYAMD